MDNYYDREKQSDEAEELVRSSGETIYESQIKEMARYVFYQAAAVRVVGLSEPVRLI